MSEDHNIADHKEEIDAALEKDGTRLGDVFRLEREGRSSEEIARELGITTNGFVYNYRRHIDAIREGKIPTATTTASQTGSAVRGFLNRSKDTLSVDAQDALKEIATRCEEMARDDALADKEEDENKERGEELIKQPGIYVYSFPHYLKHPHIPSEDGVTDARMMMKVGKSGVDARTRIFGQTAAMPEAPVILYLFTGVERIESTDSDADRLGGVEKQIHDHLKAIGHRRRRDAGGGNEWFLTNMETLASTAKLLGLDITYEYNPGGET